MSGNFAGVAGFQRTMSMDQNDSGLNAILVADVLK
jgi:hypothetical protein